MDNEKRIRRTCSFCGVTFYTKRTDSRFHHPKCRQAAYRWRQRLPAYRKRAEKDIDQLATYLAYADARPYAITEIMATLTYIRELLRIAGVKESK